MGYVSERRYSQVPCSANRSPSQDVQFLGYPHRHMFHFRVEIEVFHDDRDIEFILFKRELESLYDENVIHLDYKSCEMISDDLYNYISNKYPNREMWIEVSEDGENGSRCYYPTS